MSIESNSKDRDILNLIDQRNGEVEKLFEDKLKAQITELRGSKISKYDVYNRLKL